MTMKDPRHLTHPSTSEHRAVTLRSVTPLAVLALVLAGTFAVGDAAPAAVPVNVTWTQLITGENNVLLDIDMFDRCTGIVVGHQTEIAGAKPPVLRTSNGGRSWTRSTSGVPINTTLNRVAYAGDAAHLWFVGEPVEDSTDGRGYIGRSFDGGVTWSNQTLNAPSAQAGQILDYEGLTTADVATAWIAVSGRSTVEGRILYTTDRGLSWTSQTIPDPTDPVADVFAVSATNVWAVTDGGKILHTTNGGQAGPNGWAVNITTSFPDASLEQIRFFDANHGAAIGHSGSTGEVVFTTDGGVTWTEKTLADAPDLSALAFADANTLWVGGGLPQAAGEGEGSPPVIRASTNGGSTFTANQSVGISVAIKGMAAVRNTNQIVAVGRSGHFITTGPNAC
jgi:photosystem II stability/assembly factor-like uncharacterized protein